MRIALPIVMLCLAPCLSQAQKLVIGPRMGLNITQLQSDDINGESHGRAGYYLGFYGAYPLREKLSMSVSMLYSSEGMAYEGTMPNGNRYQAKRKLSYLYFPLVGRYHVTKRIAIATGPRLGVMVDAKDLVDIGGNQTMESVKSRYNSYAVGWVAGTQYYLHPNISIDARYHWGISDILIGQLSRRSRLWQLGLLMRF